MVAIVDDLLAAGSDDRAGLIAQRADLVAERDALQAELSVLAERQAAADREAAEIAVEATVATVKALEEERRPSAPGLYRGTDHPPPILERAASWRYRPSYHETRRTGRGYHRSEGRSGGGQPPR